MPKLSPLFNLIARRDEPIERALFEIAFARDKDFREFIGRRDFEKVEPTLLGLLKDYPQLRRQMTRDPNTDPNVIPNRKAMILLWVHADGHFRKYNKKRPAAYHSVEVDEISLLMAKHIVDRLGRTPQWFRTAVREDVPTNLLHDNPEDFGTTHDQIERFFGPYVSRSVFKKTRPGLVELIQDPRISAIAQTYDNFPAGQSQDEIQATLDNLKLNHVSTHVNLKARMQLQWNMLAIHGDNPGIEILRKDTQTDRLVEDGLQGLTLMECLGRGADNIHHMVSDMFDLRKNIIRLQRASILTVPPDIRGQPIVVSARALHDSLADRRVYQGELCIRINNLRNMASKPGSGFSESDLQVFDVARDVLMHHFHNARTKLGIEMDYSLGITPTLATAKHAITSRIVDAVISRTSTASARFARIMGSGAVL